MKREVDGVVYRNREGFWLTHLPKQDRQGNAVHEFGTTRDEDEAMVVTPGMSRMFNAALDQAVQQHVMVPLLARLMTSRVVSCDLPEKLMTVEELQYKYGKELGDSEQRKWANHPKYTCLAWIEEVHNHRTLASYWDWVMEQIQQQT